MKKKTRVVLVGCGAITGAWLGSEAAQKRVEIVGLVDVDIKKAKQVAKCHALANAKIGAELTDMLRQTQPEAVFDCTPPEWHCPTTLTALRHGCHVLGEKPMADSMSNARRMIAAANKSGKLYAVIQNSRYSGPIRRLKKFLDQQDIGPVVAVQTTFAIGAHFGGFRDIMDHVLLLDMSIHQFDNVRFLTGANALNVYCHESNPAGSWYKHGASATAVFQMTHDIVFTYSGNWAAEGCNTTWGGDWRITGERGSAVWDGADGLQAETPANKTGLIRKQKKLSIPAKAPKGVTGGHSSLIDAFLDGLEKDTVPETICTDNIRSLAMIHAAVKSADTGKSVPVRA